MKLAFFDCFSGISGDMVLGAIVDAGVPVEQLRAELAALAVSGWTLTAEKVWKNGMAATHIKVQTEDTHTHRSLSTILDIIGKSPLAPAVQQRASAIFRNLGVAEAAVHDVPLEKIHFHEVGAIDAIVDIVGACIGFAALGIESFACSLLNVGGGTAKMAHGVLPVPAPATARLLLGKPTYSSGVQRELVTPTGAAIVTTVCSAFGSQPPMTVSAIGYGAATADLLTAFELIPRAGLDLARVHVPGTIDPLEAPCPWYVLLEMSSSESESDIRALLERLLGLALEEGWVGDGVIAESGAQAKELWRIREAIVEAQNYSGSIKHDVAVPVSRVAEFVNRATQLVTERLPPKDAEPSARAVNAAVRAALPFDHRRDSPTRGGA